AFRDAGGPFPVLRADVRPAPTGAWRRVRAPPPGTAGLPRLPARQPEDRRRQDAGSRNPSPSRTSGGCWSTAGDLACASRTFGETRWNSAASSARVAKGCAVPTRPGLVAKIYVRTQRDPMGPQTRGDGSAWHGAAVTGV